jgi:hypothetical protein
MAQKEKDPYGTTFHRDGTVTVWNVFTQTWLHTARPSSEVLASLPSRERDRVLRHCRIDV